MASSQKVIRVGITSAWGGSDGEEGGLPVVRDLGWLSRGLRRHCRRNVCAPQQSCVET